MITSYFGFFFLPGLLAPPSLVRDSWPFRVSDGEGESESWGNSKSELAKDS